MQLVSIICLLVLLAVATVLISRRAFHRQIDRELVVLFAAADLDTGDEPWDLEARLRDLPEPARRYLAHALGGATHSVSTARLVHGGSFRLHPDRGWLPIRGEQYYTVNVPGFVWHARVDLAPLVWFEVRDYYNDQHGGVLARLWSTVPVAHLDGGDELARSALLRWLAEAPWFPHAFLARDHITWHAIDDHSVRVIVGHGELTASATLHIDNQGRLQRLETLERCREVQGQMVPTPWSCTYSTYREVDGVRVPFAGEVTWHLESRDFTYARFDLERIEYDMPARFTELRAPARRR